ncbi:hypothetical protein [Pelagibius sp.]|uniref:hypothetical protein n=1 Tax=Pelagibius sp. TaxID=1931238 RepID=UPI00262D8540|nr:hypothetical protein [Pelagibius sp.]
MAAHRTTATALGAVLATLVLALTLGSAAPASAGVTLGAQIASGTATHLQDGEVLLHKAHHRTLRKGHGHKHVKRHGHHSHRFHKHRKFHGGHFRGGHFHGKRHFHGGRKLHRKGVVRHHGRHACHDVVKVGVYRGHKALLGGVMCYDRHGRGYILQGSRHLVRYLHR